MTDRPDYYIIIRRVLEANRLGSRDDGGVGIGELAGLIQEALDLRHGSVIVHPEADRMRNLDWIDGWNDCRESTS